MVDVKEFSDIHSCTDVRLSFICLCSYTNTSTIKGWAALPWHSCSPIPCTTSGSSRIMPSMCLVGLTVRVRYVHLLSFISLSTFCLSTHKRVLYLLQGKDVFSPMMLLVPTRELVTVLREQDLLWSCQSWTINLNHLAHYYSLPE